MIAPAALPDRKARAARPSITDHEARRRLLSVIDLAERWQMSVQTIRNRRAMGDGPKAIKIGGAVRYRLEDVIAYEEAQLESK